MSDAAAAAAAAAAAGAVAYTPELPELPEDILERILNLCAGAPATLCAAACLSTAWRTVAMQPSRWHDLRNLGHGLRFRGMHLTDARLAALVERSKGGLEFLDVSTCTRSTVTARGVVAALRGARLKDKLRVLRVECVIGDADDEDVLPVLRAFVREGGVFDMHGHEYLLCNADVGTPGAPRLCSRLSKGEVSCEECDVVRCAGCCRHSPSYAQNFYGKLPCKHFCSDCGWRHEYMLECTQCAKSGSDDGTRLMCSDCVCFSDTCDKRLCLKWCLDAVMVHCDMCARFFCQDCAFNAFKVEMCGRCANCFCDNCEETRLKTAAEWVAELQLREGEAAVDAGIIDRLLSRVPVVDSGEEDEEAEDEEEYLRICEDCALTISERGDDAEDEADEEDAAEDAATEDAAG